MALRHRVAKLKAQIAAAKAEAKVANQQLKEASTLKKSKPTKKESGGDEQHSEVAMPSPLSKYPLVVVAIEPQQEEASPGISSPATYVVCLCQAMMNRLSIAGKHGLWLALEFFGCLPVGTVCAGTDCPVLALQVIRQVGEAVLNPVFGQAGFKVDHKFSSEIDAKKRELLEDVVNPPQCFGDVDEMGSEKAKNYKIKPGGQLELVPRVRLLVGGFPCKDVSALNTTRMSHRVGVFELSGKTGGTFGKILRYGKRHDVELAEEMNMMANRASRLRT